MSMDMKERLDALQARIGHSFSNTDVLNEAVTHKSFCNEHPEAGLAFNERLEYLGDAVLDLIISQRTFHDYPDLPEGELTRIRAELVREKNLSVVARRIGLGPCLRMGKGERKSGGEDKDSLLANALEALFGALFLDAGYSVAQKVIEKMFIPEIRLAAKKEFDVDFKTRLQELCQKVHRLAPDYVLLDEDGPDHQRTYTVEVRLKGRGIGTGRGKSKKRAEQDAARIALSGIEGAGR